MIKPKVVLLIFVSGKIVLTGAKVTGLRCSLGSYCKVLTFPSACEGAGGDIHGVQHDLHRAVRVPQAVMTAWSATPLCPHAGGSATLLFHSIGHLWIPSDLSTLASGKGGCRPLLKKLAFQRLDIHTPHFPLSCTYILANTILQSTYSWTLCPSVLVIVPPVNDSVQ